MQNGILKLNNNFSLDRFFRGAEVLSSGKSEFFILHGFDTHFGDDIIVVYINDLSTQYSDFTFHRINLLLNGIVDCENSIDFSFEIQRNHYWICMERFYYPGAEKKFLHYGAISLRVFNETGKSPYENHHGKIYYQNREIHIVIIPIIERKELFYLREGGIACFDLNQKCNQGCKFCARLKGDRQTENWLQFHSEKEAVELFMEKHHYLNLADLKQISILTGYLGDENEYLRHLVAIIDEANRRGFAGALFFATDEIQSEAAMQKIREIVKGDVYYSLTVETFTRRNFLMPGSPEIDYQRILQMTKRNFGRAYYNYILGLDELPTFQAIVAELLNIAIPYVSVFSVYTKQQNELYVPEARTIDYYLKAYDFLERLFGDIIYMHKHPFYNVSNRALFSFPINIFRSEGLWM